MPRIGDSYTLPANSWNPAVPSTTMSSADSNATMNDIATALTDSTSFYASQKQSYAWGGIAGGTANAITITLTPAIAAYAAGMTLRFYSGASANTTAATLSVNGLAATALQIGGVALTAGQIAANTLYEVVFYNSTFQVFSPASAGTANPPVRQTALSGTVDANGLPSFGGATGSGTVTQATTLIVTAANGFSAAGGVNLIGSITNASWTGLTTNGTMYLYLDIAANGTCTTGSGVLAPVYQWGGTYSVTNLQFTFNIQEMTGKVGNGATATQTNRVYVGEVTVAGAVVTVITWYQLMGRYTSAFTATLPGSSVVTTFAHNIGTNELRGPTFIEIENTTNDNGYTIGQRLTTFFGTDATQRIGHTLQTTSNNLVWPAGNFATPWYSVPAGGGVSTLLTLIRWKYRAHVNRGW